MKGTLVVRVAAEYRQRRPGVPADNMSGGRKIGGTVDKVNSNCKGGGGLRTGSACGGGR